MGAIHDVAHAPIFGAVCWALLAWWREQNPWPLTTLARQYAAAIVVAIVLGWATEVAQYLTGRDASWRDFRADALGAIAFAGLFLCVDRRMAVARSVKSLVALLAIAALVWHASPFVRTMRAYAERNAAVPVLFDAASERPNPFAEASFSDIRRDALPASFARYAGEHALRIRFGDSTWPGWQLSEPFPDWRSYRTLHIDVTNPEDEALKINVRVHDQSHTHQFADRFNRAFVVPARTRMTLSVPLDHIRTAPRERELDLARVAAIVIFTQRQATPREAYLSKIWLGAD